MKTKRFAFVAMMACVAALCLALFGCGGDNKANFVGDWTLESMSDSSMTITGDQLKSFGLEITMNVKDDGTGSLNLMGEKMDFTWEAKSATEMSVKSKDTTASTFNLADGKLTGELESQKIVFAKAK